MFSSVLHKTLLIRAYSNILWFLYEYFDCLNVWKALKYNRFEKEFHLTRSTTICFIVDAVHAQVNSSSFFYPDDFPAAYLFVLTAMNASEGATYCKTRGAHLVALETRYENDVIKQHISSSGEIAVCPW